MMLGGTHRVPPTIKRGILFLSLASLERLRMAAEPFLYPLQPVRAPGPAGGDMPESLQSPSSGLRPARGMLAQTGRLQPVVPPVRPYPRHNVR